MVSTLKTTSSNRTIAIPEILVSYLSKIKEEINPLPDEFIIINKDGRMENPHSLSMRFTRAVRKFKDSFEEKKK